MHPYFIAFDPVAFSLGPVQVHWYGIMYLLSFGLAWWLGQRRVAQGRLPVTADQFSDLAFYLMLGVILGGRIGYMVFYDTPELIHHPLSLLRVWEGGMSFHGGLLGVLVAALVWTRKHGLVFFDVVDFVAPLVPVGLGLGRLGNFINGELWGRPTTVPWGIIFPGAGPEPRHPSQLYEATLEGLVLFLLLRWSTHGRKDLNRRGVVMGLFIAGYGLVRTSLENVREPDAYMPNFPLGLTMGMLLSIPMILVGAWMVWRGVRETPTPAAAEAVPVAGTRADEPA